MSQYRKDSVMGGTNQSVPPHETTSSGTKSRPHVSLLVDRTEMNCPLCDRGTLANRAARDAQDGLVRCGACGYCVAQFGVPHGRTPSLEMAQRRGAESTAVAEGEIHRDGAGEEAGVLLREATEV